MREVDAFVAEMLGKIVGCAFWIIMFVLITVGLFMAFNYPYWTPLKELLKVCQ